MSVCCYWVVLVMLLCCWYVVPSLLLCFSKLPLCYDCVVRMLILSCSCGVPVFLCWLLCSRVALVLLLCCSDVVS